MARTEGMGFIPSTHPMNCKGKRPMNPFIVGLGFNQKLLYLNRNPKGLRSMGILKEEALLKHQIIPIGFRVLLELISKLKFI